MNPVPIALLAAAVGVLVLTTGALAKRECSANEQNARKYVTNRRGVGLGGRKYTRRV